ncbi:beta-ketoacyl-[acyl-carrier-protein] synthase II [Deinococcus irradiatisoli]|uniref:3-oxoacyl-[acyl-carrier-protein] synthase 2 n=1 Tax=Deinococcus irradiatisoli TaxID=2202254 RepID=A0A2Z3JU08_9DEIO|nr:beta-ketoacyl-ACP synthase II [Deinococcus irradiatisoli]AWN24628.1 beta-ketoacyl-[acyl-carrier-protein] synthase II [Deinococcus irradiatisoli]
MKRVVITGLGPVSPIGSGAQAFAEAQRAGKSGIGKITHFDASGLRAQIAGEVKDDLSPYIEAREAKKLDRYVQLALAAAELAVQNSGLSREELAGERTGTLIGSGIGGMKTFEDQTRVMVERGPSRISPLFIPMMIANMATGHVAMRFGATGPSSTVVTACATGSGAIGDAARIIQLGLADVMLAGGSEAAITGLTLGGFGNMHALTASHNDDPEGASRPFAASRDGFVLGEGGAVVVLEELEHAKKRGATIYAEVVGYGTSADAYHITMPAPEGRGAQVAMRQALKAGGVNPEQVGYVNAHGTSTPANDLNETLAIKSVYGEHAAKLAVSSTKSMTGHLLGAAGAMEAIAVAQALHDGVLPPTINLRDDPDPELDLDYLADGAREQQVEYAMSNSFAFGGQNAVLVFKRWTG